TSGSVRGRGEQSPLPTRPSYASGSNYAIDSDVTLYAQWKNPKAGELQTPIRSGYNFIGWFTSATGGKRIDSTTTVSGDITLYAHWFNPYNIGDETYSFYNYSDIDSPGHCFGMSMTSSGYKNNLLDIGKIGGNASTSLYSFSLTPEVKKPICRYQKAQDKYSNAAIVAGGKGYLSRKFDISSDWLDVVNYVKNHDYDYLGLLQIGIRKISDGSVRGHAVNFLYYKNVNGEDRIYAYDNNFPNQETYFYQNSYGSVLQAPVQTYSGGIDCIALRDCRIYFESVLDFDSTHVLYAAEDAITVQGYTYSYMDGSDYVMYDIPAEQNSVTIIPNKDFADFVYMDTEFSFGEITDDTRGKLYFSSMDDNDGGSNARFIIYEKKSDTPTVTLSQSIFTYNGLEQKPKVTVKVDGILLREPKDYIVEFPEDRVSVGTHKIKITLIGEYEGVLYASYEIKLATKKSIEKASVSGVSLSYGYSGKAYVPTVTVKLDGITLMKDKDYTVKYMDNKNPGIATITITGKGEYTGIRIKTFEIVDCVSALVSGKTYQLIPKNNSKTAVCSFSGRMVNNTKVYITNRSNSEAMKFKAVQNKDGTWKFINSKCELALAVHQNSLSTGAGLVLYDQSTKTAQNWKLSKKSDNSFAIINAATGYSIAMSDASAIKGTTLSMAETKSDGLQRFYLAETSEVDAVFDGIYAIKASANKTFALNIAESSKNDGENVNLYTYSNSNVKKYKVIYSGGGYYRIVNMNSGLALTVKGNVNTDGANVIQSYWSAQNGQRWRITENSNGTVTFTNALGTVLHLVSNKTVNGTNIVAKKASTSSAQKWYLEQC
ncbi:MAG: RICIN domain-containing protein, partial [Lachnospiraceae bacterium]|nr:RICIN domain-containing protein [Lachnospiraceae bacterium]